MGDHYAFADLRQLIAGRTATDDQHFNSHRNLTTTDGLVQQQQQQHYDMLMLGSRNTEPPPPPDHRILFPLHHRGGGGVTDFCSSVIHDNDHSTNLNNTSSFCGLLEMDRGSGGNYMHMINNFGICSTGCGGSGIDGGGENVHNISRWPRQETLSLLEIRSQLDPKFKEANQKGPLWDEVSRIMAEEHGYQRSGKKCREKFENLYKYYKKTKEGKAGRQDGKNYRFFRQLEALYGETSTSNHPNMSSSPQIHNLQTHTSTLYEHRDGLLIGGPDCSKICESLSLSISTEFDTTSSEENVGNEDNDSISHTIAFMGNNGDELDYSNSMEKRKKKDHEIPSCKRGKRSWKAKIRDFVDSRMKKLMETQEVWLEKMLKTLEHKEQERIFREEEWRKQETARIDREHKFWAKERAWFEARDAALMEALQRFTGTELKMTSPEELMVHENSTENQNVERSDVYSSSTVRWTEAEISSLIQLKIELESKFHEQCDGSAQEALWEDISVKMACLGYQRSAKNLQEKCESIENYFGKTNEGNKKRRENSRTSPYNYQHLDSTFSHQGVGGFRVDEQRAHEVVGIQLNDGHSPSHSNAGTPGNSHCFRFLMNEGENSWYEDQQRRQQ